jgi:hypothetical protein
MQEYPVAHEIPCIITMYLNFTNSSSCTGHSITHQGNRWHGNSCCLLTTRSCRKENEQSWLGLLLRTRWEQKYHIPLNDAMYMSITHWIVPLDVIILSKLKQLFTTGRFGRWKTTEAHCHCWQQPSDWLSYSQQEQNMVYWWWESKRLIEKVSGLMLKN